MRVQARLTWTLGASLLALSSIGGCKSELDDQPVADPLADPWVDGFDEGEAAPVAADSGAMARVDEPAADPSVDPGPDADLDGDADADVDAAEPDPSGAGTAVATAAGGGTGATTSKTGAPQPTDAPAIPAEPGPAELAASPDAAPLASKPAPAAEALANEPAKPPTPAPLTLADLHGQYRYVGGSSQRADLAAAIETAVDALPAAFRGIGRKRLTKTNPIDDGLEIVIAGAQITTIFSTGFDAGCELDGPTVRWTSKKGETYKVRLRSKGSKLVQSIEGDEGIKTTVFVLSADKNRLTVHHKITADRLPEPVTYRLSYVRK